MRVLLVEDCDDDAILIHELLTKAPGGPYNIDWVERLSAAQDHYRAAACDVVLLSLSLPDSEGIATVERMQQAAPEAPIVVITTLDDETLALSAVQRGAQDYLVKGQITPTFLGRVLRYTIERKDAERALRESEERFRAITENASDIVAVLNREGTFLFVSASVENLLGCAARSVQGTNVLGWVHPHDHGLARSALRAAVRLAQTPNPVTLRVRDARGSWHWIEAKARNLLHHPAVRGIVASARDITEQHLAQEEIKAQLSRLDQLNHITRAIADRQDLARMLPVLLAHLEDSMALDGCAIYIYDGQADFSPWRHPAGCWRAIPLNAPMVRPLCQRQKASALASPANRPTCATVPTPRIRSRCLPARAWAAAWPSRSMQVACSMVSS